MSVPVARQFGVRQQRQVILEYVDDAYSATGSLVPGGLGRFYKAVDALVVTNGPCRDYVARMAVSLHMLNDMLRSRRRDEQEVTRLRGDLYDTARQWIATPTFHGEHAAG